MSQVAAQLERSERRMNRAFIAFLLFLAAVNMVVLGGIFILVVDSEQQAERREQEDAESAQRATAGDQLVGQLFAELEAIQIQLSQLTGEPPPVVETPTTAPRRPATTTTTTTSPTVAPTVAPTTTGTTTTAPPPTTTPPPGPLYPLCDAVPQLAQLCPLLPVEAPSPLP